VRRHDSIQQSRQACYCRIRPGRWPGQRRKSSSGSFGSMTLWPCCARNVDLTPPGPIAIREGKGFHRTCFYPRWHDGPAHNLTRRSKLRPTAPSDSLGGSHSIFRGGAASIFERHRGISSGTQGRYSMAALVAPPEQGQMVSVRSRNWMVTDVSASTLPPERLPNRLGVAPAPAHVSGRSRTMDWAKN